MHDWDFASSHQQNELICSGHPLKFQGGRFQQLVQLASYLKRHLGRMHWLLCINVEVPAANKTSSLVHLVNIVKMNWHCVQMFAKYWQVKACSQTTVKCWQLKGPEQQIGGWSNYHTHWQLSPHHNSHARIARAQGTCRNSLFLRGLLTNICCSHTHRKSFDISFWIYQSDILHPETKKTMQSILRCWHTRIRVHMFFVDTCLLSTQIFPGVFKVNFHRVGAVNFWLNHFGRRAIAELNRHWAIIVCRWPVQPQKESKNFKILSHQG